MCGGGGGGGTVRETKRRGEREREKQTDRNRESERTLLHKEHDLSKNRLFFTNLFLMANTPRVNRAN